MVLVISDFSNLRATQNLTCDPKGHYCTKRETTKHHTKNLVKDAEFRSARCQLTSIIQILLIVKIREAENGGDTSRIYQNYARDFSSRKHRLRINQVTRQNDCGRQIPSGK